MRMWVIYQDIGEKIWRSTKMATISNKAHMLPSTLLLVPVNQHHIPAYIVVKDVDMKLRQTRAIQCHHRTITSTLQPKVQFVGG